MRRTSSVIIALAVFVSHSSFLQTAYAAAWPASTAGSNIGSALMAAKTTFEPSGIVWHAGRGTYIVVSDDGQIAEISSTGSVANTWSVSGNWEDVTVADDSSTIVYLAHENNSAIYAFDLSTGALTGDSWSVSAYIYPVGKLGLEALTWVPDGKHPYGTTASGGVFYAGWQYDADMYVFDVDTSTSGSITYLDRIKTTSGMSDLSGLSYNSATETIFAVYDGYDLVEERETDGTLITSSTIPDSGSWEGITLNDSCPTSRTGTIVLANDAGGVTGYGSYPAACVVIDADSDGVYSDVDCNDADSTVSTDRTYWKDQDRDGYGDSATPTTLCSATAPKGYVANHSDAYPNNRIEIYGDGVDNDGDAYIDEVNTVAENSTHPTYAGMNPLTTTGIVTAVGVSTTTGGFIVAYPDGSRYDYAVGGAGIAMQLKSKTGTSMFTATIGGVTYTLDGLNGALAVIRTSFPAVAKTPKLPIVKVLTKLKK